METEFITRMSPVQFPSQGIEAGKKSQEPGGMFRSIFEDAMTEARDASLDFQEKTYLLATGRIDDPHTVQIAASQAQLTVNMLVQLRNKALDAYNELMRINL